MITTEIIIKVSVIMTIFYILALGVAGLACINYPKDDRKNAFKEHFIIVNILYVMFVVGYTVVYLVDKFL